MRLRRPTDFLILEGLLSNGRNVAPNLAELTGKSRKNINNRLPVLADYELVRKVGPAKHSGLYEITEKGKRAVKYRDQYDSVADFEQLLQQPYDEMAADQPQTGMVRGSDENDDE